MRISGKISLLLILLVLIAATLCLAGCGGNDAGGNNNSENTTKPSENTAESIRLSENGRFLYTVIRADECSEGTVTACRKLCDDIESIFGSRPELKSDWNGLSEPVGTELVIGKTNRDETVGDGLDYYDFSITVSDKRIFVGGGSDEALLFGVEYFVAKFVTAGSGDITVMSDYSYRSSYDYPVTSLSLLGADVSEYTVVYQRSSAVASEIAPVLCSVISKRCGTVFNIIDSTEEASGRLILIGDTGLASDFTAYENDSFGISVDSGNIVISAGNRFGYLNAIDCFERILDSSGEMSLSESMLEFTYSPLRDEYINNPELYIPRWNGVRQAAYFRTFEEKTAILSDPSDTRLTTVAHRAGASSYYPENSVEAVISAYYAGIDICEIDLAVTKDGVIVLFHDKTLTRMTDFSDLAGKTVNSITLPTSPDLKEWTYEQLSCLHLRYGNGGSSAVSEFRIPTLAEVLTASKNRMFLYLDKTDLFDLNDDIVPLMQITGNYTSVLLGGTGITLSQVMKLQRTIRSLSGETPLVYVRASTADAVGVSQNMKVNSISNNAVLLNGEFYTDNSSMLKSTISQVSEATRVGGWTLLDDTQSPEYWKQMYDLGFRIIMTNDIFALTDFAAQFETKDNN